MRSIWTKKVIQAVDYEYVRVDNVIWNYGVFRRDDNEHGTTKVKIDEREREE